MQSCLALDPCVALQRGADAVWYIQSTARSSLDGCIQAWTLLLLLLLLASTAVDAQQELTGRRHALALGAGTHGLVVVRLG